jgi:hypothetical protein
VRILVAVPSLLEPRIQRLRRQLAIVEGVELGSRWLLLGALGLGVVALLARVTLGLDAGRAALLLAPAALAPVLAALVARRRALSDGAAATWLDRASGGSGAIVTALEHDDPRWAPGLAPLLAAATPPPGADRKLATRRAVLASAFTAAVLLVPVQRINGPSGSPPGLFEPALERLQEKLAALEETLTIVPEVRQEFTETLARLQDEARTSADPEATFEAIERLTEKLERTAEEALDDAARADEQLADAAARAAAGVPPEAALNAALETLAKSPVGLDALLAELPPELELSALGLDLGPDGATLPEGFTLDPELAAALSKELQELLREQLEKLAAAGLLDTSALAGLGQHPLLDPSSLAALTPEELAALEPCPLCKDLEPGAT